MHSGKADQSHRIGRRWWWGSESGQRQGRVCKHSFVRDKCSAFRWANFLAHMISGHTRRTNETFHSVAHIQAASASPFGPCPANHNRPLPKRKRRLCAIEKLISSHSLFIRSISFRSKSIWHRREVVHGISKTLFNSIWKLQCFPITSSVSIKEMSEYDGNQYLEMPNPTKALRCGSRTEPAWLGTSTRVPCASQFFFVISLSSGVCMRACLRVCFPCYSPKYYYYTETVVVRSLFHARAHIFALVVVEQLKLTEKRHIADC